MLASVLENEQIRDRETDRKEKYMLVFLDLMGL